MRGGAAINLDAVRAALGFGPVEGEAWFQLPDAELGFASHKSGTRALILRTWGGGPLAVVLPRTRTPHSDELVNPAHDHRGTYPRCWLGVPAWVVTRYPISVAKSSLTDASRLCSEEDPATVAAVLASAP